MSEKTAKQARRNNFQFPPGPQGQKVVNSIYILHYDDGFVNTLNVPKELSLALNIMAAAIHGISNMFAAAARNDQLEVKGPPKPGIWVKESNIIVPERNIIIPS